MRLMMVTRGQKKLAWLFALLQSMVFLTVLRAVVNDLGNWTKIIGYSAGFATGLVLGMVLEGRLGIGNMHINIVSSRRGQELAQELRAAGFGVTELAGQGKDGEVDVLLCDDRRRQVPAVRQIVQDHDPDAFITAEMLRIVLRGFWRK
jgi:uncharacterized protein YebE (UPF0316 family)